MSNLNSIYVLNCRWSYSCLNQLPDYMKVIYKAFLETFEEIEEEMIKQGCSYRLGYGIEAVRALKIKSMLHLVKCTLSM